MVLTGCYIAAAVRCAPPDNKPLPIEKTTCRPYLVRELALLHSVRTIVALGSIAWDAVLKVLGENVGRSPASGTALSSSRRLSPGRLLPPQPAEHQHGQVDRGGAGRGVSEGCDEPGRRVQCDGRPARGADRPGRLGPSDRSRRPPGSQWTCSWPSRPLRLRRRRPRLAAPEAVRRARVCRRHRQLLRAGELFSRHRDQPAKRHSNNSVGFDHRGGPAGRESSWMRSGCRATSWCARR